MKEHPGTPYVSRLEVEQEDLGSYAWKIITVDEGRGTVFVKHGVGNYPSESRARQAGEIGLREFYIRPGGTP
jgi:hypothetical protein